MANQEHLDILKQGVETWNKWTEEHIDIKPDLSGADLREADLRGAVLFGANLNEANLETASLREASLSVAHLRGAHLSEADLHHAHLTGAHLISADLRDADLSYANLGEADLSGAHLISADLSGAHLFRAVLSDADLNDADLSRADLTQASLRRAHLSGAHLNHANLHEAHLNHTNLHEAHLSYADLYRADLSDADLSDADLSDADLSRAHLSRADLHGATVALTAFGNVDLSVVKGLETVKHRGPSTIGIDTIYRSRGNIPEVFLKGAGVDDTFITYIRSLVGRAIEYYSCFISYSSKDEAFAKRLYADLQSNNVRCWFAPEDLKWGERIRSGIDEAIRLHDKLLLILSKSSVASGWVEHEVKTALAKERKEKRTVLFPVRLDKAVLDSPLSWATEIRHERNIGNFSSWKDHDAYQKAFERLLRDLKAEAQKTGSRGGD